MTHDHGDTASGGPRGAGRELALVVLCHLESAEDAALPEARALLWANPPAGEGPGEDAFANLCRDVGARAFADTLVDAWVRRRAEIDEILQATSARWRLDRMDRIDRNVLRLATTELLQTAQTPGASEDATPRGVVLAEAVRLARRYGSDKSPTFVNGLLDAVARRLETPTAEA